MSLVYRLRVLVAIAIAMTLILSNVIESAAQPTPSKPQTLPTRSNDSASDARSQRDTRKDYDHEREQYSEFWEGALSPSAGTYADFVTQAVALINSNRDVYQEARTLLDDAILAKPSDPSAHFWLGILSRKKKDFEQCASSLAAALKESPDFVAPPNRSRVDRAWQLGYELAICEARSGKLTSAANRLRRVSNRFVSCIENRRAAGCVSWHVRWRLGETLMALGRLEEAIDVLRIVAARSVSARYTLAVALDRDRQRTEAKVVLGEAVARDRQLRALWNSPSRTYIPATDELYYRGLARAHRGNHGHAQIFFTAYMARTKDSPWREQAASHLERSVKLIAVGADAEISGTATLDRLDVEEQLNGLATKLQKCVAGYPDQLFDVRIRDTFRSTRPSTAQPRATQPRTAEGRNPRRRPNRNRNAAKAERNVRIDHLDPLDRRRLSTEIMTATSCIRAEASKVVFNHKSSSVGAWSEVRFQVVASSPSAARRSAR